MDGVHAVGRATEENDVAGPQAGHEGGGQLPEDRTFSVEHEVGVVRCNGPDVGVVDHPGVSALSEGVLFPVDPDSSLVFQQVQHFDEIVVREIPVAPCVDDNLVGLVDVKLLVDDQTNEELGDDVEAVLWEGQAIHVARLNRRLEGGKFQQVVHRGRQETCTRNATNMVACAANALQGGGDVAWGADLDDEINRTDVDAHLKGGRGHHGPQVAEFQFPFDLQSDVLVHRAVVSSHEFTQEGAEALHERLGHFPRVGEDQRGGVGGDQVRDGFHVGLQGLGHRPVRKAWVGDEDVQIEFPRARDFGDHDALVFSAGFTVIAGHQIFGHGVQRFHGRGDADALNRVFQQGVEEGQGQAEVHPTLGRDQAVQFVNDHPLDARDDGLEPRGADGDGHAFRGGDEDVRWFPQHLLAVRL